MARATAGRPDGPGTFRSPRDVRLGTLPAMAGRSWGRAVVLALVTAAGLAAAQLGVGYGLGIVVFAPRGTDVNAPAAWSSALVWATWIAATSVVIGAIAGDRLGGRYVGGWFAQSVWRLTVALAATVGAVITLPLVAGPARDARIVDTYATHILAGIYAAIGVVLGLVVALVALSVRAVAANVVATACWLWALGIGVAAIAAFGSKPFLFGQLGVWKFTDQGPIWHNIYIPASLVMLGSALVIGGLAAFPSAGRGAGRVGVAISGAAGPLLVAVAYMAAAPPAGAPFEQASAHTIAPYVLVAGLAGSVLVAALGGGPRRREAGTSPGPVLPSPPSTRTLDDRPVSPPSPWSDDDEVSITGHWYER